MNYMDLDATALGRLLQLSSAALPVGAFAYSEGLEHLVESEIVRKPDDLAGWLSDSLCYGAIRVDVAIVKRVFDARKNDDMAGQQYWDAWISAGRESEELREQSWTMGRALWRIAMNVHDAPLSEKPLANFTAVYAVLTAQWGIPVHAAIVAYLHSWLNNLVTAGVKLIPIGQMSGQKILWQLQDRLEDAASYALTVTDDELYVWGAGQSLAAMSHESQYSRLFRS
jgi:urease accessory protein